MAKQPLPQKRTKIVATIGPACADPKKLERMVKAGLDVARINLSHARPELYAKWIRDLRAAGKKHGRNVAVLFDLQGPKMRIGRLKGSGPVLLRKGADFSIVTRQVVGDEFRVFTSYTALPKDVNPGDTILLDDGRISLEVLEAKSGAVHCKVIEGGWLGEHKGINLPGVAVSAPALTKKDLQDLEDAVKFKADYIALSFVRTGQDVRKLRKWLYAHDFRKPIIAKIEREEALENLDDILDASDGVMVARGDLGVELSIARVPVLQKQIIEKANRHGKLVITATQMLETMIDKPIPTRAEAADIANAIFDHTDAVMLSGESAAGKYPVDAVRTMAKICRESETSDHAHVGRDRTLRGAIGHKITKGVVLAAADAADEDFVKAIMVFSITGTTAHAICKQRPDKPIYGLAITEKAERRMQLYWGVEPFRVKMEATTDKMVAAGEAALKKAGRVKKGDVIVVVCGETKLRGATNMMKYHTVS